MPPTSLPPLPFSFSERHHVVAALLTLGLLVLLGVLVGGLVGQGVAQLVATLVGGVVGHPGASS
ncbi:MAG: hypothetical protein ACXVWZ_12075 [Nocardioides sp.]